jgi:hypothetical protein
LRQIKFSIVNSGRTAGVAYPQCACSEAVKVRPREERGGSTDSAAEHSRAGGPRSPFMRRNPMTRLTPRVASLMALGMASAVALAPAYAITFLETDATWQVTPIAPAPGWNTSVVFDTSSWESATTLFEVSSFLGPAYSAQGIWSSGGRYSTTEPAVWARKVWSISELPSSATLVGGEDDDGDLWINGTLVVSDHNGVSNSIEVPDLLPYLKVGDNLFAWAVTDNYQAYGYNHSFYLQVDDRIPPVVPGVPEPATMGLMFAGLSAVAAVARRRMRQVLSGRLD